MTRNDEDRGYELIRKTTGESKGWFPQDDDSWQVYWPEDTFRYIPITWGDYKKQGF